MVKILPINNTVYKLELKNKVMDLNNKVIKVLNKEHGQKVKKFFLDNGVEVARSFIFYNTEKYCYYGIIDGVFDCYSLNTVRDFSVEIIELPEDEAKEGEVVLVSTGAKRIFLKDLSKELPKMNRPIVAVAAFDEDNYKEGRNYETVLYQYYKRIPKEEIVELTLQDISDGKGKGVPSHLIRIKE